MGSAAMNINNALSKIKRGIFLFMGARISRRTLIAPVGGFACRLLDRPQTGCILIYKDVWTVNTRWAFLLVFAGLPYMTRTTSGGDADYANDRPPADATFVKRLRDAGAIILAKANLAEYAVDGARSSFGGTFCNPYDTEREPGMSSAGSASSVAANLVTCAIGEETVVSVRWPSAVNSLVGLEPTKELVSTRGMIGAGLNMRVGPMCRTVEDAARILDVIAGYDPNDEVTVSSIGRKPARPS